MKAQTCVLKSVKDYLPSGNKVPLFAVHMPEEIDKPLLEVLHSGYIGQGPKVEEFEGLLRKFVRNENVITTNNGTAALHLALRLAGVSNPDDEVITTAMTCTATNEPILANNGTIVWADIDAKTGLIDPLDVERKITGRTKAIMVVDWGGTPVDLDEFRALGKAYDLPIIEDACHAFGSTYKNRRIGSISDYTCFSFQAIKHITTVDGGLLTTSDGEAYRRGRLLRWYGIDRDTDRKDFRCEEDVKEWGYKFHMNDVTAVIGIEQMKHIDRILGMHRENAKYYMEYIDNDFYGHPTVPYASYSSFWLYTITLPTKDKRQKFMQYMNEKDVVVSQVHARNDTHTMFKAFRSNLPNVNKFTDTMVCIPVHWKVTVEQREKIIDLCNKFAKL